MRKLLLLTTLLVACSHTPPEKATAPPTAPKRRVKAKPLTSKEIVAGFEPARPRARECFARHKASGTVLVRVRIAPSGQVEARTLGALRGTPASACFEKAVTQAAFRPNTGMILDYPFRP